MCMHVCVVQGVVGVWVWCVCVCVCVCVGGEVGGGCRLPGSRKLNGCSGEIILERTCKKSSKRFLKLC